MNSHTVATTPSNSVPPIPIPKKVIEQLASFKIIILGLGREGWSSYQFIRQILPKQTLAIADQNKLDAFSGQQQKILAQDKNLNLHLGKNYLQQLDQYNLIVKTPGIPASLDKIQLALKQGSKLTSNLQIFLEIIEIWKKEEQIINNRLQLPYPLTIGVTGTKGKSTTASLINHVLGSYGLKTVLMGNIGQPALSMINQIKSKGILVIEMSSHQLAELSISPDIAVVQNITSEHLDYYANTSEYIQSKMAITKYQKVNQYVIYNPRYPNAAKTASFSPGRKIKVTPTSTADAFNSDIQVYSKSHNLTFRDSKVNSNGSLSEEVIISHSKIPLLGKHNLHNVAPAIAIGKLLGLPNSNIKKAIASFQPLPHRLEKVAVKNKVTYVNDSMATMPDAVISALSCFDEGSVILIAGGHERGQDFSLLAKTVVEKRVKALALFPTNGERLLKAVQKELERLEKPANSSSHTIHTIPHLTAQTMPQALEFAQKHAKQGSAVLLSPGAASFGIFENYADRGNQFKKWVKKLTTSQDQS